MIMCAEGQGVALVVHAQAWSELHMKPLEVERFGTIPGPIPIYLGCWCSRGIVAIWEQKPVHILNVLKEVFMTR